MLNRAGMDKLLEQVDAAEQVNGSILFTFTSLNCTMKAND